MIRICNVSVLTTAALAAAAIALYVSALQKPLLYKARGVPSAADYVGTSHSVHWVAIAHTVGVASAASQIFLALYVTLCPPAKRTWFLSGLAPLVRMSAFPCVLCVVSLDLYAGISFALLLKKRGPLPEWQLGFAGLALAAIALHVGASICVWSWWRSDFGPPGEWSSSISERARTMKLQQKSKKEAEKMRAEQAETDDNAFLAHELDLAKAPTRKPSMPSRQPTRNESLPITMPFEAGFMPPTQQWLDQAFAQPPQYQSRDSLPVYVQPQPAPGALQRRATWDTPTRVHNGPLEEDELEYNPPPRSATWMV